MANTVVKQHMVDGLVSALAGKATPADITTAINNLIGGAPAALDTLNELAAALADDAAFATTMTNALAGKISKTPQVVPNNDYNQAVTAGIYIGPGALSVNPPPDIGAYGPLLVMTRSSADITQLALVGSASFSDTTNNAIFFRGSGDGGTTWSSWKSIAFKEETISKENAGLLSGFRNKIINGNFIIAQRGTSGSVPPLTSVYICDRWLINNQTNQALDWTVQSSHPYGGYAIQGGRLGLTGQVAPTSGDVLISQRIEDVRTFQARQATSFIHVLDNPNGFFGSPVVYMAQYFGVGGSAQVTTTSVPITGTTGTVAKALHSLPTTGGMTIGAGDYLSVVWKFTPRNTGYCVLTNFGAVEGDATKESYPFTPRHIQQELALCQRYYSETSAYSLITADAAGEYLSDYAEAPVTLRVTPTVTLVNETVNTNSNGPFVDGPSVRGARIYGNSLAAGTAAFWQRVKFDAEL